MTREQAMQLVNEHASALSEHFESVRIFVTWPHEDDAQKTLTYDSGRGNWYAQYGQVVQWISAQDEEQRQWTRDQAEEE